MNRFIGSSPVVTTNNYYTIANIHNLQWFHTNLLSLFPLVFIIRFLAPIYNTFTVNKSSSHTPILLIYDDSVLQFNLQSGLVWILATGCLYIDTARTTQKTPIIVDMFILGDCLATNRNIRHNNGLPIVVMQY
jgi:membrane-anchored protein YejM (alkaline phosphatase superfamily)